MTDKPAAPLPAPDAARDGIATGVAGGGAADDTMAPAKPLSPCIGLCRIEAPEGLCIGCGRSLDEIARWSQMDDPAREAVMAALPARRLGRS